MSALFTAVLSGTTLATSTATSRTINSKVNTSTCLTKFIQNGTTELYCGRENGIQARATAAPEPTKSAVNTSTCLTKFVQNGTTELYCGRENGLQARATATTEPVASPSTTCEVTFLENGTPSPYCTPIKTQAAITETIKFIITHASGTDAAVTSMATVTHNGPLDDGRQPSVPASAITPVVVIAHNSTNPSISTSVPTTMATTTSDPLSTFKGPLDTGIDPSVLSSPGPVLPNTLPFPPPTLHRRQWDCKNLNPPIPGMSDAVPDPWTDEQLESYYAECTSCIDLEHPPKYAGWTPMMIRAFWYKCLHPSTGGAPVSVDLLKLCGRPFKKGKMKGKRQDLLPPVPMTDKEREVEKEYYAVCFNTEPPYHWDPDAYGP
ncbi:hypothetical protein Slin15195_G058770 [Septoria linicola]|uniref:Uncharacterized protein n=1 Tax=Septoria linicola TaxID=215465 RepID=A0A9Q9AUV9_9PEZI|nr:hypothetical protein Slin14017_G074630 [Septoria linicola]USW52558.1 hypothetical protein Slin15195_G058770 [Septoria linicola]